MVAEVLVAPPDRLFDRVAPICLQVVVKTFEPSRRRLRTLVNPLCIDSWSLRDNNESCFSILTECVNINVFIQSIGEIVEVQLLKPRISEQERALN